MNTTHHDTSASLESREPGAGRPRLVVGDDGSPSADQVWSWVNNHHWPGWQICVLTAKPPLDPAPVGLARAEPHIWHPEHPRELINGDDVPKWVPSHESVFFPDDAQDVLPTRGY